MQPGGRNVHCSFLRQTVKMDISMLQRSSTLTQHYCYSHSGWVYMRFNLTSSNWPDTSASTNRSMNSRTWADSGSIAVPLSWAETNRKKLSLVSSDYELHYALYTNHIWHKSILISREPVSATHALFQGQS